MRKSVCAFALVAGVALVLSGMPVVAADHGPDVDRRSSMTDGVRDAVDLVFEDRPYKGRSEKPRPKRRDPGRQNMNGLPSVCQDAGPLFDFFGFSAILRGCSDPSESFRRFR